MTTKLFKLFGFLLAVSMITAACVPLAPSATPTPAAPTTVPTATATATATARPESTVTVTPTPAPTFPITYSEAQRINIEMIFRVLMGTTRTEDRGWQEEFASPLAQKCEWMLGSPHDYFYIPWELYQRIGAWCHAEVTLVDYLYKVGRPYTFVKWNAVDQTVNAVFLVSQRLLPIVVSATPLNCNGVVEINGVRIQTEATNEGTSIVLIKGEDLIIWHYWGSETQVLVFITGAPLNDDVLVEGKNTRYEYIVVYPCPAN